MMCSCGGDSATAPSTPKQMTRSSDDYLLQLAESLPRDQRPYFLSLYEQRKKSAGLYCVLALLLGTGGFHLFYLGQTGAGLVMLFLSLTVIGLVITVPIALLQAVSAQGSIKTMNNTMAQKLAKQLAVLG